MTSNPVIARSLATIVRVVAQRRVTWLRAGSVVVDVLLVSLVVFGGAVQAAGAAGVTAPERAVATATLVVLPLAVAVRRWRPGVAVITVVVTVTIAASVVPLRPSPDGATFDTEGGSGHFLVAISAVLFAAGSTLPLRRSLVAAAALLATTALPRVVGQVDGEPVDPWLHLVPALFVAGVYLASLAMRSRRLAVAQVEQYAAELERTRGAESRAAVAEERLRMARELHDVISHHLSLVSIQLAAAEATFESRPATARDAIATARESGLAALDEMRAVVGALREDPSSPAAKGMAALPGLLGSLRDAGLDVSVCETGSRRPLAPIVDLAAFRIVQESLTNVLRHSGAASADLALDWTEDRVRVRVRDGGPAPGRDAPRIPVSVGHGLTGMQERVSAVRGLIAAGPRADGGFEVDAVLPYVPGSSDMTDGRSR